MRAGLRRAGFEYIENCYSTRRLQSSLDYLSPVQYENLIHHNADRQGARQHNQPVRQTGSIPPLGRRARARLAE
jgi:hypothetical protein